MNTVAYIAFSMDGYIAKSNGGIDWSTSIPAANATQAQVIVGGVPGAKIVPCTAKGNRRSVTAELRIFLLCR